MSTAITPKFPKFLHGGDYNPDQWLDRPDILEKDIELMKKSHCNCMSVGIFSWAQLEPYEGVYRLDWLADVIDNLYKNGIYTILATPSGGKPAWMTERYPEIARVNTNGQHELQGRRQNHCMSSPIYREKVRQINQKLAERFANHPGVIMWHISNEFGNADSDCHCEHCQAAFREWLKNKYKTLDNLNYQWWNHFWSHTYTSWNQVHSPLPYGEYTCLGLLLDWKRFITDLTYDFIRAEAEAVRPYNPQLPVTTNLMNMFGGLDYFKIKDVIDVISWDNYPYWHSSDSEIGEAQRSATCHDLMRSLIPGKPFMLMESCPGPVSWHPASRVKRPGMHKLSSLQAVAHGSDTVQYFQWRMSRGGFEKFHGAVVDHYGEGDTRMFKEVTDVGETLEKIQDVYGSTVKNDVAILFDWQNRWATEVTLGPRKCGMHYDDDIYRHHQWFWENNIGVDFVCEDSDISGYKVVVAPLMYMLREGFAEKIRAFVANGGTFITTYVSGLVNENDLCYLGGFPGLIGDVLGMRATETDGLYDRQTIDVNYHGKIYQAFELCDLIAPSTAETIAEYASEFYASTPAITVNKFGKGKAYYLGARLGLDFLRDFYPQIMKDAQVEPVIGTKLPEGVVATRRTNEKEAFLFIQNYNNAPVQISLDRTYRDLQAGTDVSGSLELGNYGIAILSCPK